jgi:hypothetical protein
MMTDDHASARSRSVKQGLKAGPLLSAREASWHLSVVSGVTISQDEATRYAGRNAEV